MLTVAYTGVCKNMAPCRDPRGLRFGVLGFGLLGFRDAWGLGCQHGSECHSEDTFVAAWGFVISRTPVRRAYGLEADAMRCTHMTKNSIPQRNSVIT